MDKEENIFYCIALDCKQPTKIISSFAENLKNHNGHVQNSISGLREELQLLDSDTLHMKEEIKEDQQDLISYINNEIDCIKESFSNTIEKFSEYLKQFVIDNLISLKKIQILFKAVLENNSQLIHSHQDHLDYLRKDSQFFQDQKDIYGLVKQQLEQTFQSTKEKISKMDQINLPNPSIVRVVEWSNINKHINVTLEGKSARNHSGGYNSVLIEPRLSFQRTQSVRLMIKAMQAGVMIQICDLRTIKTKCQNFDRINQEGFGAYSHECGGCIYGTDTYGQGTTKSFKYAIGDILELHWNGPQKKFTTHKVNTGEKQHHHESSTQFRL